MKKITFPCELKVDFDEAGEITCSAHYGVEAEGIGTRRGMELVLSSTQKTQIKNFAKNVVLPKIKEHEEIA